MTIVLRKSKYKGVCSWIKHQDKTLYWRMGITRYGETARKDFPYTDEGEKMAAKAYDLKRIEFGLKPVNILKKK
jgi:hypothetical protein